MKKIIVLLITTLFIFNLSSINSQAEINLAEQIPKENTENFTDSDSITDEELADLELKANAILVEFEKQQQFQILQQRGVKSKAVIKVAQIMKSGGDEVIDLAKASNIFDAKTANVMKVHSSKIGNFLDTLSNAGSSAASMARTQLPNFLTTKTTISKGTAENIAIAVSWAIRGADWLFLTLEG